MRTFDGGSVPIFSNIVIWHFGERMNEDSRQEGGDDGK
jgi:hypothetical protein